VKKKAGSQKHDIAVGFSGGKDSTALVDILVEQYGLNPLLITVDTGFMTDIAKQNIRDTLAKMGLEDNFILVEGAIPAFSKLYKTLFEHHDSAEKTLTVKLCHPCTDLIHVIVIKEAMKESIPVVLFGFSPDQIMRYFYETEREDTIKDGKIPAFLKNDLDKEGRAWYLSEQDIKEGLIPRVLYPYHVIDYDEEEIITRIESKGLIQKGKGDPVLTNCHAVKAALLHDLYRHGGITYALQYAELVRQQRGKEGHGKYRRQWLRILQAVGKSLLNGTFDADGMEDFFSTIGMKKEELIDSILKRRALDPRERLIIENIGLIRCGKLR